MADAWGVKGWIKVQPFSSEPQALLAARQWFLQLQSAAAVKPAAASANPLPPVLHITASRRHGEAVVASAEEVPDRTTAEALKGARVFVSRASFPQTGNDEFYWVDLIGLSVVNRQGETLGRVADLIDNGPQAVLRIVDEQGAEPVERLVPFVAAYVDDVNLDERRITVDWGLDF